MLGITPVIGFAGSPIADNEGRRDRAGDISFSNVIAAGGKGEGGLVGDG
jgi:hypothetical protein